ncbi:MAG: WD40/YVTN/BNR-like repeat-containing protein, partial [Terriglobia bacterium]
MGVFFHSPRRGNGLTRKVSLLAALLAVGLEFGLSMGLAQGQATPPISRSLEWEQWFYGQRTYGLGYIPEGALTRAVEQRDRPRTGLGFGKLNAQTPSTDLPPEAESDAWVSFGPGGIVSTRGDLVSGRVTSLAIDPRNSSIVYVAAAGGGVWKTTNRGKRWQPMTDQLPSLASGAVAVDPFSGDVWYGTGELNFCRDCYYGAGVYRLRDGGATWERVASEIFLSSPTSVIRFDSRNRGALLIGRSTALWKSSDGGATWRAVLRGAITDIAFNPADSSIAYAAVGNFSGSPENGIYRSTDGGETWVRMSEGLPSQDSLGRIALGTAPTPSLVYALIVRSTDFNLNGLYRSLDGGVTWSLLPSLSPDIFTEDGQGQGAFNLFVRADPRDAGVLYVGARDLWKSADFGNTWQNLSGTAGLHEDQRDMVFDPSDLQTFYLIGDSGVWRSSDGGQSFANLNATLAVTQFQTVGPHPTNPNLAVGGTQDNGTVLFRGGFAWNQGRPGDSGAAFFDRANPQTIYTVARRLSVRRSDDGGKTFRVVAEGLDPNDRVQFYPPLIADPNEPGTLYFGTQRVWRSQDGGEHWTPLSGDLTGGGSATLTALAVAPSSSLVLYAGTSDGLVKVSRDGGRIWSPSAALPGRFVTSIAVHSLLAERAFVGLSGFGTGHVFRTENGGGSWEDISRDLPDIPVNAVLVEPLSPDRVFIGTDIGVFVLSAEGSWA